MPLICAGSRALARQKGVTAGAMLQWRYHPMTLSLKRALADGALGDIMTIEAKLLNGLLLYRDTSTYLFDPQTAGHGILSWLGCHCLDLVLYLMQERVVEVMAMVGNLSPQKIAVEDTGFLILRFESGKLGTFQAGYHLRGDKATYDFYIGMRGTEGHATLPLIEPQGAAGQSQADPSGTYNLFTKRAAGTRAAPARNTLRFPMRPHTEASWPRNSTATSLPPPKAERLRLRRSRIPCICWRSSKRPKSLRPRAAP